MQRELKFRVWDKLQERFTRCDEGYQGHYVLSLKGEYHNLQNGSGGKECIVQQYTGLVDKNGVDIYEGDIIKVGFGEHKESLGKVIFEYGAFMLTSKYGYNFMDTYKSCLYGELIGNIFENSEQLK